MSALERLMAKNLPEGGVRKKKHTKRKTLAKSKAASQGDEQQKRVWTADDEVQEWQQKILERKQQAMEKQQHSKKSKSSKNSLVKKQKDYVGVDTTGLTPGLAPVGVEDSDSESD